MILQYIKTTLETNTNTVTSYVTSSKVLFIHKDGHLAKASQKDNHDTASQFNANRICEQKLESSLIKALLYKLINSDYVW